MGSVTAQLDGNHRHWCRSPVGAAVRTSLTFVNGARRGGTAETSPPLNTSKSAAGTAAVEQCTGTRGEGRPAGPGPGSRGRQGCGWRLGLYGLIRSRIAVCASYGHAGHIPTSAHMCAHVPFARSSIPLRHRGPAGSVGAEEVSLGPDLRCALTSRFAAPGPVPQGWLCLQSHKRQAALAGAPKIAT